MENELFHNQECSICSLYVYLDSSHVHLFVTYYSRAIARSFKPWPRVLEFVFVKYNISE